MNNIVRLALVAGLVLAAPTSLSAGPLARDPIKSVETGLRPALHVAGTPQVRWTIEQRMRFYHVPAVSVAVIRGGKIAWARAWGVLQAGSPQLADADTMFSVGSVSKVAAAAVTLRMVDAGKLDLDRDVRGYLTRWHLPETQESRGRPVTLREILSHTAGFTVSGFPDFLPGRPLPTLIDTLEGRPPAVVGPVTFLQAPGEGPVYSGGGISVEQLIVEEQSGMSFAEAARIWLLAPLGLSRSTFEQPLPESWGNVAKAHDAAGKPRALPRGWESMPETAASGLWTTPSEYARFLIALLESYRARPGALLSRDLAWQMMTPVGPSPVGLGPFVDGHGFTRRFSHSGSNDSYKSYFEMHLATGNGVVIFTNGASGDAIRNEVRRAVAAAEGWELSTMVEVPDLSLPAQALEELAGSYRVELRRSVLGGRTAILSPIKGFDVSIDQGALWARGAGGGPRERLVPETPTQFVSEADPNRRFEFVRGVDGRIGSLLLRIDDAAVEAVRAQ